jgi:hypothetical protein
MNLRRFSDSVVKQDWFTVMVENLIVVIGVFIGLQAVNLRTHISLFTFSNQDLMNSLHAIAEQAQ